ncbi:MAG: hypothetical protein AB1696_02125 [Planctomycetota bacterium]
MLGPLGDEKRRWGCGRTAGIGCLVFTVLAVIGIVWFLRFLVAPGNVPSAEVFITPECKGFLIVRIRPGDQGVMAFLVDREKKFQKQLQSGEATRPPWIFRQLLGETPSQTWKKLMPIQMVWTVERWPESKKVEGMSMFSMARGKGVFWGLRSQLMRSAEGAESAGKYKERQIILLKEPSVEKKGPENSREGKEGRTDLGEGKAPAGTPILGLNKPTTYPWVTIFETTLLEASSFEGMKRAIDLAADANAGFAGKDFIKSAYESFDKEKEAIGALADEEETAAQVMTYLLAQLSPEEQTTIQERVKLSGIRTLSGWADIAAADRAHARIEAVCADEKKAQAVHSTLAIELGAMQDKKSIEALALSVEGPKVSIEFDVTDLDDLPRGEREKREKARNKLEEQAKKKTKNGDADDNH